MKRAPRFQLVLFDLDGTLARSLEIGLETVNSLRFFFGYKKLYANDPRLRQHSGRDFVKHVLRLNPLQYLVWFSLMKILILRNGPRIRLYPGVKKVLTRLRGATRLGIVTSAPRTYARTILKKGGVDFFDVVLCGIAYHSKSAGLAKVLQRFAITSEEVLYIGDELRDGRACAELGIPFIGVDWGTDHRDVLKRVPSLAIISRPEELLKYCL
jgi:phosphoglycolate phosphatase-like HAD superfamily hydrolase